MAVALGSEPSQRDGTPGNQLLQSRFRPPAAAGVGTRVVGNFDRRKANFPAVIEHEGASIDDGADNTGRERRRLTSRRSACRAIFGRGDTR